MEPAMTMEEIEITLESDRSFFELLAVFYREPLTQEQIDAIVQWDFEGLKSGNPSFDAGLNDIFRYLRKRNTGTRQALATDYTMSFCGVKTYKEKTGVPVASLYVDEEGEFYTAERKKVSSIFRNEYLRLRQDIHLPEDHLAFELEFLAALCDQCLDCLHKGQHEEALRKLELSSSFVTDNILTWFDQFAAMCEYLVETRFYRGVLLLTKGFLEIYLETVEDIEESIRAL